MALVPKSFRLFFALPVLRRAAFHFRRMTSGMDGAFFGRVGVALLGFLLFTSTILTLAERDTEGRGWHSVGGFFRELGDWFYWSLTTSFSAGDSSAVQTAIGQITGWLLILFGVAIVAAITGALVGFLIEYLLKEGMGMGAAGFRDHIVVCGWNSTARELVTELEGDEFTTKVVVIHDTDKNPAGDGVYFVSGDITRADDLRRAGIEEAMAAVICPADGSNEADMRSILCVMAIEAIAPEVRTVVEANNPAHVEHFQRAEADEIVVSSRLVSRLMARSSLYPGLAELVTDIVSGGDGSELYRVSLPDNYVGLSVDELSSKLRAEHRATLLSISRNGQANLNPPQDFRLQVGDDLVVVAESLGELAPLEMDHSDTD
ncbi:NAD-binding protein [Nocardioides sp.]|uniref:potassium channel family protein n=1 Tax=Nocardioides sp. TaxID=35761 RepID=UPI001A293F65|nr:NAD-binding protein [Nocardioides sp.]MBJ7357299.1 NAD-binding protein [Nocardioides sp.]